MTVERDIDTSSGIAIAGMFGDTGYYRNHPFLAIEFASSETPVNHKGDAAQGRRDGHPGER
jgi:hypothetical protein